MHKKNTFKHRGDYCLYITYETLTHYPDSALRTPTQKIGSPISRYMAAPTDVRNVYVIIKIHKTKLHTLTVHAEHHGTANKYVMHTVKLEK